MAFYEHNSALFTHGNLADTLEEHLKKAFGYVDQIPSAQFMVSTDEQIVQNVIAELEVVPLELHCRQEDS